MVDNKMNSFLYLCIFFIYYINQLDASFYVQYLNESCYCDLIDVEKIEPNNFDKPYLTDNFRLSNNNQTFEIFETEYFDDTQYQCKRAPWYDCNRYTQSYVSSEECATNDYELVLRFRYHDNSVILSLLMVN